ncbi:hypothetical protein RRG08_062768 [Elysia crispata]|uniref:Uncharacterized protein n=1 Tax=Elysia crispata TaxID=231223 RepID=A0AAE0Z651_9GAST|nr:hypothetical protein RRG08_062768 [Elysia crispata]
MTFSAYNESGRETTWLTDRNDATCNNGGNTNLTIKLRTPFIISWVRIVVKDTAKNDKIYLSYKQNGIDGRFQCDRIHSAAMVVERTYDIVCDTHVPVKEFSLYAEPGVLFLCSLYISGGVTNAPYVSLMAHTSYRVTNVPYVTLMPPTSYKSH